MNPFPWEKPYQLLVDNMAFVVATIVSHKGSTPRTSGTKMIVTGNGTITGTIGGGLLEARVMEKAVNIINAQGPSTLMPFDLSYEDVETMDMICGGRAEIFLDYIRPGHENIEVFKKWQRVSEQSQSSYLITAAGLENHDIDRVCHGIINEGKVVAGDLPLPSDTLTSILRETSTGTATKTLKFDEFLVVIEPAARPKAAFLFGAGHVAKPTAHLCALVGFRVTVLDDRETFANAEQFPDTHEIKVLDSFESAFTDIEIEEDAFVVIFTRGHLHDRTVLAGALKTRAGYIGMIGSRKKRDAIYNALIRTGYSQRDIDRVHSPIGIAIGGKSPEEIAVSIVAEMIQERNRMNRG